MSKIRTGFFDSQSRQGGTYLSSETLSRLLRSPLLAMACSSAEESSIRRLSGSFSRPRFLPMCCSMSPLARVGGIKSLIGLKSSWSSESKAALAMLGFLLIYWVVEPLARLELSSLLLRIRCSSFLNCFFRSLLVVDIGARSLDKIRFQVLKLYLL